MSINLLVTSEDKANALGDINEIVKELKNAIEAIEEGREIDYPADTLIPIMLELFNDAPLRDRIIKNIYKRGTTLWWILSEVNWEQREKKRQEDLVFAAKIEEKHKSTQNLPTVQQLTPQITAVGRILNQQGKLIGLVLSDGKQQIDSPIEKCIAHAKKSGIKNVKAVTRGNSTYLQGNGISLESLPHKVYNT